MQSRGVRLAHAFGSALVAVVLATGVLMAHDPLAARVNVTTFLSPTWTGSGAFTLESSTEDAGGAAQSDTFDLEGAGASNSERFDTLASYALTLRSVPEGAKVTNFCCFGIDPETGADMPLVEASDPDPGSRISLQPQVGVTGDGSKSRGVAQGSSSRPGAATLCWTRSRANPAVTRAPSRIDPSVQR